MIPVQSQHFKPTWWLRNPHLQTIYANFFRADVKFDLNREKLATPDKDYLDIAYPDDNGGPLVLVFHGLEGSLKSHYTKGMLRALYRAELFPVFMHFRGCNGEANLTTRRYHSCETSDPKFLMQTFSHRYPGREIYALGFSLGGNMLLKWLSDMGTDSPISKAVAISVPFDLADCNRRVQQGLSKIYNRYLLGKLHEGIRLKYEAGLFPADFEKAYRSRSFHQFDEYATAPLHGFASADDYYARCSSRFYLGTIHTPTLIIQSTDDPFLNLSAVPTKDELPPAIEMELTEHGGHVGFISGSNPFHLEYWLETRSVAFFKA